MFKSRTFGSFTVGQFAEKTRVVTAEDVETFAKVSGDYNPLHFDREYAAATPFKSRIVHGALITSFVSGLMGMELPGTGSLVVSMKLKFRKPVFLNSAVTTKVEIMKLDRRGFITLACVCSVENKIVVNGEALVSFPRDESS